MTMTIRTGVLMAALCGGLFVSGADAQVKPIKVPTTVANTATKITAVTLSGAPLACTSRSATLVASLTGASGTGGKGKVSVSVRVAGAPTTTTATYDVGADAKKDISINVPLSWNCASTAVPTFSVSLEPATGGWDRMVRGLAPKAIEYQATQTDLNAAPG